MARLIVLGSAQDGGLPHAGCGCRNCSRARRDSAFRRLPAALGVIADGASALIDATNAFEEQTWRLSEACAAAAGIEHEFRLPDDIVLTHAHTGHWVGLWQLDRSVLAARGQRVRATAPMIAYLSAQQPWAWMLAEGFIVFDELRAGEPIELAGTVTFTPLRVPHRAEWDTDTVGLLLEGPRRRAFYLPDIDSWDAWHYDIANVAGSVDVAILDGCFWTPFHIPGVPHPPIRETLDRLQPLADAGKHIVFTHLNHSNPAADPESAESAEIRERGFLIAREGDQFEL